MNNNAYKTFLRCYYLANALYDCIFAYAIYTVLFHMRGLSVFQISLLLGTWSALGLVFEIPSGALADSWNRKTMLTIAPLLKAICFLVWTFADGSFYLYVVGFAFWELGSSFVSGTAEALLYDALVHFGKTEEYEKIVGRKHFYYNIGLAVASISGGLMAAYSMELPVILSVVPLMLSSFFASKMPQVPKSGSTGEVRYLQYIRIALGEMRTNHTLLYLGAYALASGAALSNLEEFDQLYYQLARLPISAFGVVGCVVSLSSAWSAAHAHRLKDRPSVVYLLPAVGGVLLVLVAKYPSVPMLALLVLSYTVMAPLGVLMEPRIQRNIGSVSRATVTSLIAFVSGLTGVVLPVALGCIGRIWNLQAMYMASAIFLFVVASWAFLVRDRLADKHQKAKA